MVRRRILGPSESNLVPLGPLDNTPLLHFKAPPTWFHLAVYQPNIHAYYPALRALMIAQDDYAFGDFRCTVEYIAIDRRGPVLYQNIGRLQSDVWKTSGGSGIIRPWRGLLLVVIVFSFSAAVIQWLYWEGQEA